LAALVAHDYNEQVTGLAITPDGKWVVAGSRRGRFSIFDVSRQERGEVRPVASMGTGTHKISWLALTPDHTRAISAGEDSTLRVWNLESRADTGLVADPDPFRDDEDEDPKIELRRRPFDREAVLSALDAPAPPRINLAVDGSIGAPGVTMAAPEITLTMIDDDDDDDDEQRGKPKVKVSRHGVEKAVRVAPNGADSAAAAFDRDRLACIARDGTASVWDLSSETLIASLPTPGNWEPAQGKRPSAPVAVINADATRLMAVRSGHLHLWAIDDAVGRPVADGVRAPLYAMAGGATVAAFCDDGWLRIWRLEDGTLSRRTRVPAGAVTAFAGDYACWVTLEGALTRYDLTGQSRSKPLTIGAGALKLSADARWGVTVSSDLCTLWDFAAGRRVVKLPVSNATCCAFWIAARDGYAAAAARDLMVWSIPDGRLIDRVTGDAPFNHCEFVDGRTLTAGIWRGGTHTFVIGQK